MLKIAELGSKNFDMLGVGEILERLLAQEGENPSTATAYQSMIGGTVANVAAAIKAFGLRVGVITAVPDNAIGVRIRNSLRGVGISDDYMIYDGSANARLGIYRTFPGIGKARDQVFYDRAHSSFCESWSAGDLPENINMKTRLFHISGVELALNENVRRNIIQLVENMKAAGVPISCDYNFRLALWAKGERGAEATSKAEAEAKKTFDRVLGMVDYLNVSLESCHKTFALGDRSIPEIGKWFTDTYGISMVSITVRDELKETMKAYLYDSEQDTLFESREYSTPRLMGRIGSGDAFVGGCLGALLASYPTQTALEMGVAFAAYKLTKRGDMLVGVDISEVEAFMKNNFPSDSWGNFSTR